MLSTGQLKKLKIKAYSDDQFNNETGAEYTAQINPESYTVTYENEFFNGQAQGTAANQLRYNRSVPQKMDFQFVFDGTGVVPGGGLSSLSPISIEKPNIIDSITEFKKVIYDYYSDTHEPNYVKIYWGTLLFRCRLTNMSIEYKLFNPDGTPIRAYAKCSFTGTVEDSLRVALLENPHSPDLTHIRTVKHGDTLPLMAYRIYGDESLYMEVAKINKLKNFRELKEGQELIFPPVDKNI